MRNWRVLTAIAAAVLALLAGVLVWKYADNAKNDAKKGYEFATVLVAAKRIPENTSFAGALDNGQITRKQVMNGDLPESAINGTPTNAQLAAAYRGQVTGHAIVVGQTLVKQDFVGQGQVASANGLAGQLQTDEGKNTQQQLEAITVTVDDQHAVAGFLSPGDSVNVVAYGTIKDPSSTSGPGAKTAAFLLPGLKVIAVGNQTTHATSTASATSASNASSATSASRSLVTFEVTPRQALQLVQAEATMAIYLTLNPPSFKPGDFKDPGEVVEALNLFDRPLPLVQSALAQVKAAQGK